MSGAHAHTMSQNTDTFEIQASAPKPVVPPDGTDDPKVLSQAPSPDVTVAGEIHKAEIVVDVENNILYHYDESGSPLKAYLVATGAPRTPTHKGIRIISHVESYPYKGAPASTKRRKKPYLFGERAIILDKVDPSTGNRSYYGEFIHGTNQESSVGKKVSGGCMRMSKKAIKELSSLVTRKRYVRII